MNVQKKNGKKRHANKNDLVYLVWGVAKSYQQHSADVCNTEVTCAGAR